MRYYIIAGEASGDLHGGLLIEQLQLLDSDMHYRFWGGEHMEKFGGEQVKHYKQTAFMGFWEVLWHLKTIKENLALCQKDIVKYHPDVVILIDYPGFNLRIAKFVKQQKIPVFYYISPKIWAWKTNRVYKIKKYVDAMFCILPFEKAFYEKYNYPVHYVGNPLLDVIEKEKKNIPCRDHFLKKNQLEKKSLIALLPGSRKQEIQKCLPEMIEAVRPFRDEYQIVVAGINSLDKYLYREVLQFGGKIVYDQTHALVFHAEVAVVVSGTAVLETAVLQTPQVALYKISPISYLFKPLLKVKFFTLPNLILSKEVVKEFLQFNLSKDIYVELKKLLTDQQYRQTQLDQYVRLTELLGNPGAAQRAAKIMIQYLKNTSQ